MTTRRLLVASSVASVAVCCAAHAGVLFEPVLEPGLYELHNHPNVVEAPPPYGLRLDELVDVSADHDIFTFDFDHPDAAMFMEIGGNYIDIFGTVYGGLNQGSGYGASWVGLWSIQFTYNGYSFAPGDDDYTAIGPDPDDHWGTITALFDNETSFWMQDESGGMDFSFRLGDEDDDNGHKNFDGVSGWGWLNHAPVTFEEDDFDETRGGGFPAPPVQFPHTYDSDWIFTVGDRVPEPGSLALLALGGLAVLRRRR